MLERLFNYYLEHPKEIGQGARNRIGKTGFHRAIAITSPA